MKIAFTTDTFVKGQGGVSSDVAMLAPTLRERGHQFIVYSATDTSHNHTDPVLIGSWTLRYERFHAGRTPGPSKMDPLDGIKRRYISDPL